MIEVPLETLMLILFKPTLHLNISAQAGKDAREVVVKQSKSAYVQPIAMKE